MSERQLLLSSAKSGVIIHHRRPHWTRNVFVAFGVLAIVIGAAGALSTLSKNAFGANAAFVAFAPAAAITDPSLLNAPAAGPATTTPLVPVHLAIPSIGVSAKVESVGQKSDGSMATPSTWQDVAWYNLGPKPGEAGNAVIDGHVNNALTTAGVFEHLGQIAVGDSVVVSDASGRSLTYTVSSIEDYDTNAAPLNEIFSTAGPSQIVLITCAGDWDPHAHAFDKRLVVVARLSSL
ncbi:MAG TPA: class F sortase [Candidatus Paceibacterota bacterium]|nr:class F sortase [Candidatus Paceibacterota bacterium]